MNTAMKKTTKGSESNNTINLKRNEKKEEINLIRQQFAGGHYQLKFVDEALGASTFWLVETDGIVYVVGFSGKKVKRDFHYRFRSVEFAKRYQDHWYENLKIRAVAKAERKERKKQNMLKPHGLAEGDVLVASWGYDQTNYDYYQITRMVGKNSIEIRELQKRIEETGFMQGDCIPIKNAFKGEQQIKRIGEQGLVKVRKWGVWASKKETYQIGGVELFKPDQYTSYA